MVMVKDVRTIKSEDMAMVKLAELIKGGMDDSNKKSTKG